jgi:hypothetical protein
MKSLQILEESIWKDQVLDPSTYPTAEATAQALGRPLFGHVIDGEQCPPAASSSPATGRRSAPVRCRS